MSEALYAAAKHQAIEDAMHRSSDIILLGSLLGGLTPHQRLFDELAARFPGRVLDPPSSELGLCGVATGASVHGLRPMVDIITASFVFQGFPQVVNEAANVRYSTAGTSTAPVVFHMLGGIRTAGGPQHSHRPQAMFWHTPGLDVMLPSNPQDVYELMTHALLHSTNPTVFLDHPLLLGIRGELDTRRDPLPIGRGRVLRAGTDATVVATSVMATRALEAARILAAEGVDIEIIDPRTLVPFDEHLVLDSIKRTGRLVVTDESNSSCGVAAEIITRIVRAGFTHLKAPPVRVATPDVPIPFGVSLEQAVVRSADHIAEAVRAAVTKAPAT